MNIYANVRKEQLKEQFYQSEYDVDFFLWDTERLSSISNDINTMVAAHVHPTIEILYITEGNFKINIDGKQAFAHPGDMVLFRANAIHSIYHMDDSYAGYYVLKISPSLLFHTFKGGNKTDFIIPFLTKQPNDKSIFAGEELSQRIKDLWQQMIADRAMEEPTVFHIEKAHASTLLILLYRSFFENTASAQNSNIIVNSKYISLIYESVNYINENYASNITTTDCASLVNLSYSYYAKLFQAVMGKTFTDYLKSIRLAKAYNILLITDLPITDVAMSCGYTTSSHFAYEYKRHFGITPRETRKLRV